MGTSTESTGNGDPSNELLLEFEPHNQGGYAFTAVSGRAGGWLLKRLWIIPLMVLWIILITNWAAFMMIEEDRTAINIFYSWANREGSFFRDDGHRFYETQSDLYFLECAEGDRTPYIAICVSKDTWSATALLFDSVIYLIPIFSMVLCAAVLYTWFIHRAPKSFYTLAKTNRLIPQNVRVRKPNRIYPNSSITYVRDLENALQGPMGKVFALFIQVFVLILVYFFATQRDSIATIQSGFLPNRIGEFILIFIIPLMIGYLVGLCMWVMIVVAFYLAWLTPTYNLNIRPYHQDGCGGLKPIGDIALMMALIYVIPGVLLGIWAFGGLLGRSISAVTILTSSVLLIIFFLSIITFVLPVYRVHSEMEKQRNLFKERYEETAASKLEAVKHRLRQLVAMGRDQSDEGQVLKYDLELLEKLYPDRVVFRTWPFGYAALAAFAVGQSFQVFQLLSGWASRFIDDFLASGD